MTVYSWFHLIWLLNNPCGLGSNLETKFNVSSKKKFEYLLKWPEFLNISLNTFYNDLSEFHNIHSIVTKIITFIQEDLPSLHFVSWKPPLRFQFSELWHIVIYIRYISSQLVITDTGKQARKHNVKLGIKFSIISFLYHWERA